MNVKQAQEIINNSFKDVLFAEIETYSTHPRKSILRVYYLAPRKNIFQLGTSFNSNEVNTHQIIQNDIDLFLSNLTTHCFNVKMSLDVAFINKLKELLYTSVIL